MNIRKLLASSSVEIYMGFLFMLLLCKVTISSSQDSNWLGKWESKMPNVHLPELIVRGAPTFTMDEVQRFIGIITNGSLVNHATEFCKLGHLLCTEDVQLFNLATSLGFYGQTSKWKNLFFGRKSLVPGYNLTLPDFNIQVANTRFLPKELADKFTISSSSTPHLAKQLGIPETSNMSRDMHVALSQCEAATIQGETKTCLISFEEMAEFVVGVLGHNNILAVSNFDTEGSNQQVTITSIKKLNTAVHPVIACHLYMFPFALYMCHYITNSLMYQVFLKITDGRILQRFSVCHPGYDCHWILPNDVMWLMN